MKTNTYRSLNALILAAVGLLLISPVMSFNAQARRVAGEAFKQPVENSGRLIIHRLPTLGKYLFVDLRIDGMPAGSIGWGQTYDSFLAPGRHVLSFRPVPFARWGTFSHMVLDVRSDQTYSFTAIGDHTGNLILVGG